MPEARIEVLLSRIMTDAQEAQARQEAAQARQEAAYARQEAAYAEAQARQEAALAEVRQEAAQQAALLMAGQARIEAELATIKQNTIIIMGKVISDFSGISPEQKAVIETAGNELNATEEDLLEGERRVVVQTKQGQKLVIQKTAKRVPMVAQLVREYTPDATRGTLTAAGNWVSSVMFKMTGLAFKGKYPERYRPMIESLVGYYTVERPDGRMY